MPPTADNHQQLLDHPHDDQLANDDAANTMMSSLSPFAVREPPVDEEAAAERQTEVCRLLAEFRRHLGERTARHLGYPYNLLQQEDELQVELELAAFQGLCINNLGDPFVESNYGVHSRPLEVAVLDWFARLWGLRRRDAYWGYVTACGTEGNLHGLLLGRELLPDGALIYASADSHYSVFKAARMYRVRCVKVDALVSGEMDCDDFRSKLMQNTDSPAIVNVNIGTTVKGAVDDLDRIIATLQECGFRGRFYIHCDGALAGLMTPFIKQAPKVTFDKPIGSVSVSGHKFLGCPVPCGVVITRREHAAALATDVEYLSSRDVTIMGSRNGHAPLFLWHALTTKGRRGIRDDVQRCLSNARCLVRRLRDDAGVSAALMNPFSNTVVLERPRDDAFVRRWQLACQGDIAHVVVMPSVGLDKIDAFVQDLAAQRSRWYRHDDDDYVPPCVAKDIGQQHCLCGRLHTNNER